MSTDFYERYFAIQNEHAAAIKLLTALNEGDDSVRPAIRDFLKRVKDRVAAEAAAQGAKKARAEKRASSGRKNNGNFEVAPRYEQSCDYGATGLVLARKGAIRLIWRSGSKYWANQLDGTKYTPGELAIQYPASDKFHRPVETSLTNNFGKKNTGTTRLTKKLVEAYIDKIDEVFGAGTAVEAAKLEKTIVLAEGN